MELAITFTVFLFRVRTRNMVKEKSLTSGEIKVPWFNPCLARFAVTPFAFLLLLHSLLAA
jgi:hypothetical protein